MKQWARGFSKLEFALSIAVLTVAAYAALQGLRELEEYVEMRAVEGTLSNAAAGLRFALAERINRGEEGRIAELIGSNPVQLLAKEPDGYLGELALVDSEMRPRAWAYDRSRRELCYRPLLTEHLQTDSGVPLLRWRIEPAGDAPDSGRPTWARLAAVSHYRWF